MRETELVKLIEQIHVNQKEKTKTLLQKNSPIFISPTNKKIGFTLMLRFQRSEQMLYFWALSQTHSTSKRVRFPLSQKQPRRSFQRLNKTEVTWPPYISPKCQQKCLFQSKRIVSKFGLSRKQIFLSFRRKTSKIISCHAEINSRSFMNSLIQEIIID